MYNHPISSIKKAARRILGSYFFRCAAASFITGTGILLVFNYVLDGTMQVESAFDTEQFYQAILSGTSPNDIFNNICNNFRSLAESVGYAAYMAMLKRFALAMIVSYLVRLIYNFFVVCPFAVGLNRFYMDAHYTEPKYRTLLLGFKQNYLNVLLIQFLRQLKVFLWSLLFIIPGAIKSYETFMVPYLLAENPDIDRHEVFEKSREMMDGNKLNVFVLNLSFIGWLIFAAVTSGLAYIVFVAPYYDACLANIALRIKSEYNNRSEN